MSSSGGSISSFIGSKWATILVVGAIAGGAVAVPVVTGESGAQSCPAFPEFPDAACTGVPAGTSLTDMTVAQANTAMQTNGAVINSRNITGTSCVEPEGHSVTIKNSRLKCVRIATGDAAGNTANPRFTIQDSEIDCGGIPAGGDLTGQGVTTQNFDVLRVEIVHCSDGVFADGDASVIDSYIHDMAWNDAPDGIHVDGIQGVGGTNMTIRHNRIVVFDDTDPNCTYAVLGNENASCNGSSAITINNASGLPAISNNHIEYNLVGGGSGATVYCSIPSASSSNIEHNRWMSGFRPGFGAQGGPTADCGNDANGGTTDETWSDNLWYDGADAGDPVPES